MKKKINIPRHEVMRVIAKTNEKLKKEKQLTISDDSIKEMREKILEEMSEDGLYSYHVPEEETKSGRSEHIKLKIVFQAL